MANYLKKKRRQWLNKLSNHNKGHLQWGYCIPTEENNDKYAYHDFEFVLFDCARSISLDLGAYTEAERRNSIRKLRIISGACEDLIDVLCDCETGAQRKKRMKNAAK